MNPKQSREIAAPSSPGVRTVSSEYGSCRTLDALARLPEIRGGLCKILVSADV